MNTRTTGIICTIDFKLLRSYWKAGGSIVCLGGDRDPLKAINNAGTENVQDKGPPLLAGISPCNLTRPVRCLLWEFQIKSVGYIDNIVV